MKENEDQSPLRIVSSEESERLRFLDNSYLQADELAAEGKLREAANLLEKILSVYPKHLESLNLLGWLISFKLPERPPQEAIPLFRTALENAPAFAAARFNLACTLRNLGRYEEAIAELTLLLEDVFRGPYPEAWYELGLCLEMTGRYPEALEVFEKAFRQEVDLDAMKDCRESMERCRLKAEWDHTRAADREGTGRPARRPPHRRRRHQGGL